MRQSVACLNEGSVFSDIGIVDHAGFLHRQHQKVVLNDEEHPVISSENHIVGRVMSFIANLLKFRSRAVSWSERGYPGIFAAYLGTDMEQAKLLKTMQDDWALWEQVKMKSKQWVKLKARSPFVLIAVRKIFGLARQTNFMPADKLHSAISDMFACIGNTNVGENGFRIQRHAEGKSTNRNMSDERRWMCLALSKVAETRFDYQELPGWRNEVLHAGWKNRSTPGMYRALVKDYTPELSEIVTKSAVTPWFSTPPQRECTPDVDVAFWRLCSRKGTWNRVSDLWLGCLLSGQDMFV